MNETKGARTVRRPSPPAVLLPVFLSVLFAFLFAVSCATVPPTADAPFLRKAPFAGLGSAAAAYLKVDMADCMPVMVEAAKLLGLKDNGSAFDRTESIAIAVFAPGAPRRFAVVAKGRYPPFWTALSLTMSREWKRERDGEGRRYWRSAKGYSLSFFRGGAFISDGPPFPDSSEPVLPRAVEERYLAAAAYGWMPVNEAALSALPLNGLRLPVRELSFGVEKADGLFSLSCVASAASSREARALSALLNLARTFGALDAATAGEGVSPAMELFGMLTETRPTLDGNDLLFLSRALSATELALLCSRFSVYLAL